MFDGVEEVEDAESENHHQSDDDSGSDEAVSIGNDSAADGGSDLFEDEAEAAAPGVTEEEKAELHGRIYNQSRAELDLEKDFTNEIFAKLNKLIGVLRGGAEFSDQLLNTKDLIRMFSISNIDDAQAPPTNQRVGEQLLLNPSVDIVPRVLQPLYSSPHDELIELAILLTQKLSESPHPNFATIYPPHKLQQYKMNLSIFKNKLISREVLTTWSTYCEKIRGDLSRGGMSEDMKLRKTRVQTRLDQIKANEMYEVIRDDMELQLVPEKSKLGDNLKGAVWHTTGQRRLSELAALNKIRKSMISKTLIALKQCILNFLKLVDSPKEASSLTSGLIPWQGSERDLEFVRMLFTHNLVELFQKEQHILIDEESFLREKRRTDRRDEFDNFLGSDDGLLIRNMEFLYQLIRNVSPLALSIPAMKRFLTSAASQSSGTQGATSLNTNLCQEVRITRFSLDISAALTRQQGKIGVSDKKSAWLRHGDRQRFTKLIGVVHKESRQEQIESGEFQYGAVDVFQLLGESWTNKETIQNMESACKIYWQNWTEVELASFTDYVNEVIGTALDKFWNAWIRDIELKTTEVVVSAPVICRLISILSWTMIYTYGVAAQLLVEMKTTTEHFLSSYFKKLEEHLGRICYWSRLAFQTRTMTFISSQLARELRLCAKDRSHALLRASTRLMVLQNAWAKLLFESTHVVKGAEGQNSQTQRLKDVGRNLYIHIAKNQSCTLIVRLLQNYTTANAEMELLLYTLLSIDQLDQASRQIAYVASKTKKKVFARRGNKVVDMGVDFRVAGEDGGGGNADQPETTNIMSAFRPVVTSPKTLTKLLFLASKSELFPIAIRRAVFNLLGNLAATDVGRCIAWDLQRLTILNSIICSKEPLAQNLQGIIMESIKLLADCSAKNPFVVVEVLFGSWLLSGDYTIRDIINNYKLIQQTGCGGDAGGVSAWTMSQTRAMMNAYEKAKYTGGRSVLRQIRMDLDSEDVDEAVRRFNLVDPTFLGDEVSQHIDFDQALARWILTSDDQSLTSQLLDDNKKITDIIKVGDEDEMFTHLLTKLRPIISRNGGKLDDLCVGMTVTTLLSEIMRWEIDQRFDNMDAEDGNDGEVAAPPEEGTCQDYLRKVTRHLYGLCNMRKHRINPFTLPPEVSPTPDALDEGKPKWVKDSVNLILLMIHCDPSTREPFSLIPLNTLETRTHLTSMALSRPLADLESKVVDIQKNQQALMTLQPAEVIRIFKRTARLIRELGELLSDVKDVAMRLISKLEVFCASQDAKWDQFLLSQRGDDEEEENATLLVGGAAAGGSSETSLRNPWGTKTSWNLQELIDGLYLPNLKDVSEDEITAIEKKAGISLGPLGTSLEYQAWLHSLGGISNAIANPTEWEWNTVKITRVKLAKYLLIARFVLQASTDLDCLTDLNDQIQRCESEIEIWKILVDPISTEKIDESIFTDEKINYKLYGGGGGGSKKKAQQKDKENHPQKTAENVVIDPPESSPPEKVNEPEEEAPPEKPKKKKLIIKRKRQPPPEASSTTFIPPPAVNSILAIEDGVMSEPDEEEEEAVMESIDECQKKMTQQFEEACKSPLVQKPAFDATLEENARVQELIWQDDDLDLFSGALSLLAD